jgi:hypothetical protein
MGLYDNYKLDNSSQVPQYVGSALPEIAADYQQAQQTYDAANAQNQQTADAAQQIPHLDADKQKWQDMNNEVQQQYKDNIEKGDFENMYGKVATQARILAQKAQPIMAQHAAAQEYQKQIGSKENNLDAGTQSDLYAMAMDNYAKKGGVQVDSNGKAVSGTTFNPGPIAKSVDKDELTRQALSILSPYKNKTITKTDNGWIATDKEGSVEHITDGQVMNAFNTAKAGNKEWQAYDNQDLALSNWKSNRDITKDNAPIILSHVLDNLPDSSRIQSPQTPLDARGNPNYIDQPNTIKQAMKDALQKGVPADQILTSYNIHTNAENQRKNEEGYAKAKEYTQTEATNDSKPGELWLYNQKKKIDKLDDAPFMIQGPDTKLTDAETDPNQLVTDNAKLNTSIASLQADKGMYETQLKTIQDPNLRAQTQANLDNTNQRIAGLQNQVGKSNELLSYSKNKTALDMGYSGGYPQFLQSVTAKLAPVIQKQFPNGIQGVSARDISEAVADGRVVTTSGEDGGAHESSFPTVTITTKDGKVVTIHDSNSSTLSSLLDDDKANVHKDVSNFQNTFETNHKNNVQDYTTKSEVIGISENDSKNITRTLKAASGGLEFSEPGQMDNIKEKDRPVDYRVTGIAPDGTGAGTIFKAEGLDDKGQPTGKSYDVKGVNSNISQELAKSWMNTDSPEAKLAATMVQPGSGYRYLAALNVGQEFPLGKVSLPDGSTTNLTIRPTRTPDNGIVYTMYDGKGNIVRTETSMAKAGRWIDLHKQASGQ